MVGLGRAEPVDEMLSTLGRRYEDGASEGQGARTVRRASYYEYVVLTRCRACDVFLQTSDLHHRSVSAERVVRSFPLPFILRLQ